MNKKILFLSLLTIALLFTTGCQKNDNATENEEQKPKTTNTDEITSRQAFEVLKPEIKNKIGDKSARLGKISGMNVKEDGSAPSWIFTYYINNPDNANYTNIHTFTLTKSKVTYGQEKLLSQGLSAPEFDYIWNDLGDNWLDSSEITKKIYAKLSTKNPNGIEMHAQWNKKIKADGGYWEVKSDTADQGKIYLDLQSGEEINK